MMGTTTSDSTTEASSLHQERIELPDLFLAVLALVAFALTALELSGVLAVSDEMPRLLNYIDLGICFFFFADFLKSFVSAPDRWKYMKTWGWFDLLSSVPVIMIPHDVVGKTPVFLRIVRLVRVFRAIRSIRILTRIAHRDRSVALLTGIFLVGVLVFIGGCIGVLWAENRPWLPPEVLEKVTLDTADGVLWWAVVTSSTVGYGDYSPITGLGRMFAFGIMIVGIGSFATLTSALGILIARVRRHGREPMDEIIDRLDRLESMIGKLEADGRKDANDQESAGDRGPG